MELLVSLAVGLFLGGVLGYFILKLSLSKSYILRTESIGRDVHELVSSNLATAKDDLKEKDKLIFELNTKLTELQSDKKHLNEKIEAFNSEFDALHRRAEQEFKNLATSILEEKKKIFVEENKRELNTILSPLKTNLDDFKNKVEATRKEDIQDLTSLKNEIQSLQKLNFQLCEDAEKLATALTSDVKTQGHWGEDRLKMILECEGLQKYIDYTKEETYRDEEQEINRRPDYILKLPNSTCIIIDSKVSLTAYVNYFNTNSSEEKSTFLKQHLKSFTDHVLKLANKNYQTLLGLSTSDFVFMFVPIESALTLALNENPSLLITASKKKIALITPSTLVATLKIVRRLWQKENQVKNVESIFKQCGELYNKFVVFLEEMNKVESSLNAAAKAHHEAMNHLTSGASKGHTIIGRFERIRELEASTNKEIPTKYLNAIQSLENDEIAGLVTDINNAPESGNINNITLFTDVAEDISNKETLQE